MKIKNPNHLKKVFLEINLDKMMAWKITILPIMIGWNEKKYIIILVKIRVKKSLFINFVKIFFKIYLKFWKLIFLKFAILCFL